MSERPSRRLVLGVGLGGFVASLFGVTDAEARKGRKKRRRRNRGHPAPPLRTCAVDPDCTTSGADSCICASGVCVAVVPGYERPGTCELACPPDTVRCIATDINLVACLPRCPA